jgi:hypothetical protein
MESVQYAIAPLRHRRTRDLNDLVAALTIPVCQSPVTADSFSKGLVSLGVALAHTASRQKQEELDPRRCLERWGLLSAQAAVRGARPASLTI